jgi:hypothetical protein
MRSRSILLTITITPHLSQTRLHLRPSRFITSAQALESIGPGVHSGAALFVFGGIGNLGPGVHSGAALFVFGRIGSLGPGVHSGAALFVFGRIGSLGPGVHSGATLLSRSCGWMPGVHSGTALSLFRIGTALRFIVSGYTRA